MALGNLAHQTFIALAHSTVFEGVWGRGDDLQIQVQIFKENGKSLIKKTNAKFAMASLGGNDCEKKVYVIRSTRMMDGTLFSRRPPEPKNTCNFKRLLLFCNSTRFFLQNTSIIVLKKLKTHEWFTLNFRSKKIDESNVSQQKKFRSQIVKRVA